MEIKSEKYDGRGDKYEDSPRRERREGSELGDDEIEAEKSSKYRSSKDRRKGVSRGEDNEYHRSRDRDRDRDQERSRDKRKDDRDVRDKDKERSRDKVRDKDRERDKDKKNRSKEKERDRDREVDKERVKDKHRDREREKEKEILKEKEREKLKDLEEEREGDKDKSREKAKDKIREKQKARDADHREKGRDRDRVDQKAREIEENDMSSDGLKTDHGDDNVDRVRTKGGEVFHYDEEERNMADIPAGMVQSSASELQERISRMKEERLKKKSEGGSEILAWVNKSRKIEEKKKAEKEKALQLSRVFAEQDNLAHEESDDDEAVEPIGHHLAGVKVLHGLDKVAEGGAVVLTLKDQSILADGNINEEVDMLENVEIGEQKRRNEAYKAAKKKSETYEDKFNDVPGSEKKILPQYDDPVAEEGVTLDAQGRVNSEAEKKLEELRRRLQGPSINNHVEDLTSSVKVSSDYYTHDEMLKFKKPKKKKALRKKEKLDVDALEAEAVASGLGAGDLGSRNDGKRQAKREDLERSEAEKRNSAYQSAYAKAEEASKSLLVEQTLPSKAEEDESLIIADDDADELYKSLERARKLAIKKQREEAVSGPQAIARLAANTLNSQTENDPNLASGDGQERIVFTEMEEFVWGLQLNEEAHKPDTDVFMEEDDAPKETVQEMESEDGGWSEVKYISEDEHTLTRDKEEMVPDETLVETAVGKGLSGALKLLKERGSLKETIEWGGRNMDKKKSKLVGIVDNNEKPEKEIRIERTDEFGRILTPKEAFRLLSHKFHGKEPGKMKKEKRMKQYFEDLKLKQMKNSDTPSHSVERMRQAQAKMKTPYLVLSGHVKPGQTSDPTSGFATVEKDGGLTPMLGDKKVEHFLGIKRKAEHGNSSGPPKKPRPEI